MSVGMQVNYGVDSKFEVKVIMVNASMMLVKDDTSINTITK